jgi:hypothetical protein
MNLKLKIKSSDLEHYNNMFTHALQLNFDYIDYADFNNVTSFLKKVADKMYGQNYDRKPTVTINVDLNEYKTLLNLIKLSKNFIEKSIYYCVVMVEFVQTCEKQISKIRHNQIIFFDTQINKSIKSLPCHTQH